MEDELLKISEIAEVSGVLPSTIRHYTDLGLLRVAGFTDGGHRLYSRNEVLERVAKIQALTKKGFSLPEIKSEMEGKAKVKKVLVVDDETEICELVSELLKMKFPDWEVKVAQDGFTAGRMLGEFLPHLVILDLMLPGVNGFEVCKQLHRDPALAGIKVLAITGYDSPDMRAKIMEAGADDYLAKPMDNKVLIEKINGLLGVTQTLGDSVAL